MAWTDDKVKQLKKLWTKGKSAVEIAKELGISKNSVIGKVHRLNLASRPSPIKKKTVEIVKPAPKKITGKCQLMDLKTNTCHWPIGVINLNYHFFNWRYQNALGTHLLQLTDDLPELLLVEHRVYRAPFVISQRDDGRTLQSG